MNTRISLLLTILLSIASLNTFAAPIDRLMERSGLNAQIDQFPAQIEMGMAQGSNDGDLTADELTQLKQLTRHVFTAESLRNDIKQHLSDHMDKSTIKEALVWLDSPLGKKITTLESAASTPDAFAEMQQQAGDLSSRADRVNAVQRFDQATGATDAAIGMSTNVAIAITLPMVMRLPAEQQPDVGTLVSLISKETEKQRQNYEPVVLMSFLYTYQSLTDEELEQYISFAESAPGQVYHATTFEALNHAFINHGKKLGELFSDSLQVAQQNI